MRNLFAALIAMLLSTHLANSHHASYAIYDQSRTVTIDGIVTDVRLVNPHARLNVDVLDDAGDRVTWSVEMSGKLSLSSLGWTDDTVSVGERVTVTGSPARSGSPRLWFTQQMVLGDGTELLPPGSDRLEILEELRRQRARLRDGQSD